jgi:hypothetical protein
VVDCDNFLSGPDPQHEGAAAAAEDGVWAIVQQLERRHGAAAADPDEAGGEEVGWQQFLVGKIVVCTRSSSSSLYNELELMLKLDNSCQDYRQLLSGLLYTQLLS